MTDGVFKEPSETSGEENPEAQLAVATKRINDKDDYIKRLEGEAANMRKELEGLDKAEKEIQELKQRLNTQGNNPPNQQQSDTSSTLTEEGIASIVAETITSHERSKTASQNLVEAQTKAIERFGSEEAATKAVQNKAAELKLPVARLQSMAQESPTAFLQLLGKPEKSPGNPGVDSLSVPGSTNNANIPANEAETPGTKAYFDKIKKDKGKAYYFSPKIQNQIREAYKAGTYKTN